MNTMDRLRNLLRRTPLYAALRRRRQQRDYVQWEQNGRQGAAPHLVKQKVIRRYAESSGCRILVETGTYKGEMLEAMESRFDQLYSIELQPALYERACDLFRNRPQIRLLQGDSGEKIGELLAGLREPAVFWLDGHYSAGNTAKGDLNTPIVAELNQILEHPVQGHVILIDDARLFNGTEDYPTLDFVKEHMANSGPYDVTVEDDVIAVTRRAA